ncbi:DNA topoisomerase 2-alpha-like isoform X1 [Asterias rubens]|uniref:DNA topoisomerase 2-alpha-like isoform X1 n=1 Tax=Asterias rubens TaxID=7604 RepID=UPI001455548F|nr:DNA topoisomerase 2-alpha-like isoform X1 [Asterias rubens]
MSSETGAGDSDQAGLKWVNLFENMNAKEDAKKKKKPTGTKKASSNALPPDEGTPDRKPPKSDQRLSVERIYQKKTQLEHILLRPDTYIGSVEPVSQTMWVIDDGNLVNREVTFVPGLYKIFDEILVNAADNKQRDPSMNLIKITIDPENNLISIWNNGKGIPIVEHKTEKLYVPSMIFGHLLTSSNYDDSQKKVTGGRNGYGAKLCNIFSTKFTVVTACKQYHKKFKQTWTKNMTKTTESKIVDYESSDYTEITFQPDLAKFKMESLDKDTVALLTRRAYDIAGSTKGVRVSLNGNRLPVTDFKTYVDMYLKDKVDDTGSPLKVAYEVVNPRWEVCLTTSEKGFQQVSFVNGIATTKGGRHIDYVSEQVTTKLIETIKKKNRGGINIKPFQIKNHIWVFVNCLIENPAFDSQTKENMTLVAKKFGSECKMSDKFFKAALTSGVVENIMSWMKFKQQSQLDKKCHTSKHSKIKGIPKLDDANDAGGKHSQSCTLILTEGDSAKALAVSGLGVVGRDRYGVFPLKGKLLNVREATHHQIMENAEINNIIKIMGLQYKNKYETPESLRSLRYGKLMIMTDQDQDGSHIKGLLVNFIHNNWPNLLKHNFLEEFITPIVKVTKAKDSQSFYSIPEFEQWKNEEEHPKTWKIKYYKGLGTSTMKEAKEYFSDMIRHRIPFKYAGPEDDSAIILAFSKKKCEERKEWLTDWLRERKSRREAGLHDIYLYGKQTKSITYNDFINKELVLFSNADNERSIPSMVDGLKPGQRKVIFTAFKRYEKKEVKVAQMAGAVSEISAYHHGEVSLMNTIINLAQNYIGSNNLNLLQPIGQFGTRLYGGKDAASPRYIFTQLSSLARLIFPATDDPLLNTLYDDNQRIEPEWYCPIIPMVLINGTEGIGTGWSTKMANYDVREVVANVKRMLDGEEPLPMIPSYKNFKGTIEEVEPNRYVVNGEVAIIDNNTIEITELPVRTWTQSYKESTLEPFLHGSEKVAPCINDYKEYHTDTTVKFLVKMNEDRLMKFDDEGLHKAFKLQTIITQANSMVMFDQHGCIKKYTDVCDILKDFYELRLHMYIRRKDYLEGILEAESSKLNNQARFIMEKIEGTIVIENKKKKEMISLLVHRGYDSDPVKMWKEAQNKLAAEAEGTDNEEDAMSEISSASSGAGHDYNYLLGMALWSLTREKKDDLLKNRDEKGKELCDLRRKTPVMLWRDDLAAFEAQLEIVEQQEKDDEAAAAPTTTKGGKKQPRKKVLPKLETKPSPYGRRVVPRIDAAAKAIRKTAAAGGGAGGRKRKTNVKKEATDDTNDTTSLDDSTEKEPMSLAQRLAAKGTSVSTSVSNGGTKKVMKQKTLTFKPTAKKRAKASPKKKKRNAWSESDSDAPLDEDDLMITKQVPQSPFVKRAAAQKAKYSFSDDDEDDDDDFVAELALSPSFNLEEAIDNDAIDSDADDFSLPTKRPVKRAAPKIDSDSDSADESGYKETKQDDVGLNSLSDSDGSAPPSKQLKLTQSAKKTAAKPKATKQKSILDMISKTKKSSDDSSEPTAKKPAKAKAAPKPRKPAAKKTVKTTSGSGDGDSDVFETKKKAAPRKTAKPKTKKINFSDSESGDENFASRRDRNPPPSARGGGRAKASVKYNFGDDDSDSDY